MAKPAAAWLLAQLFHLKKRNPEDKKLPQPPQVTTSLKVLPVALVCAKNINDCLGSFVIIYCSSWAIIYIFCTVAIPCNLKTYYFFFQLKNKNLYFYCVIKSSLIKSWWRLFFSIENTGVSSF